MKLYLETGTLLILTRPGGLRDEWGDWLEGRLIAGDRLYTSTFALVELDRRLGGEKRAAAFPEFLADVEALVETVLPLGISALRRALTLETAHDMDRARARHAALVLEHELDGLVAPDEDYAQVPGLTYLAPDPRDG